MKINTIHQVAAGFVFAAMCAQAALAATTAETLYKQCAAKETNAEKRECYPAAVKQSELELVAAEKKARAAMVDLERESEGSRSLQPVMAFDNAERAYRAFRAAESSRVMASYGSGNGGGLASYKATIEMNFTRIKQLQGESGGR